MRKVGEAETRRFCAIGFPIRESAVTKNPVPPKTHPPHAQTPPLARLLSSRRFRIPLQDFSSFLHPCHCHGHRAPHKYPFLMSTRAMLTLLLCGGAAAFTPLPRAGAPTVRRASDVQMGLPYKSACGSQNEVHAAPYPRPRTKTFLGPAHPCVRANHLSRCRPIPRVCSSACGPWTRSTIPRRSCGRCGTRTCATAVAAAGARRAPRPRSRRASECRW